MDIIDIPGRTHVFGAPKDWNEERDGLCGALPVRAEAMGPGLYKMISEWRPNEIELEHLKLGAPLQLGVVGVVYPVVSLGVGSVPVPKAEEPTAKLSRVQRLMDVLERGPDRLTLDEEQAAFRDARALILALMGISAKPKGEQIAVALAARARQLAEVDQEDSDLGTMVKFARRWLPECFPATDVGQVPFARAVIESVLDAADAHLKREQPKETTDHAE